MTDSADAGSVQAEPAAGNPSDAAPAPENGSAGAGKDWVSGLSEGNRKLVETKGWTADDGLEKALTSYSELERKVGSSLSPPADDAPPEEWSKFYDRLGRPKEAKYEFKLPADYPSDVPYNDKLATSIQPVLHDAGLTPRQAQKVHDGFAKMMVDEARAEQHRIANEVTNTNDLLVKKWGPKDGEQYIKRLDAANKAIRVYGVLDDFKSPGPLLLPDGTLRTPNLADMLSVIGEGLKEDSMRHGNQGSSGRNPFKEETKNITEQSRLAKHEPELARRMIKDAGKDPAAYRL